MMMEFGEQLAFRTTAKSPKPSIRGDKQQKLHKTTAIRVAVRFRRGLHYRPLANIWLIIGLAGLHLTLLVSSSSHTYLINVPLVSLDRLPIFVRVGWLDHEARHTCDILNGEPSQKKLVIRPTYILPASSNKLRPEYIEKCKLISFILFRDDHQRRITQKWILIAISFCRKFLQRQTIASLHSLKLYKTLSQLIAILDWCLW